MATYYFDENRLGETPSRRRTNTGEGARGASGSCFRLQNGRKLVSAGNCLGKILLQRQTPVGAIRIIIIAPLHSTADGFTESGRMCGRRTGARNGGMGAWDMGAWLMTSPVRHSARDPVCQTKTVPIPTTPCRDGTHNYSLAFDGSRMRTAGLGGANFSTIFCSARRAEQKMRLAVEPQVENSAFAKGKGFYELQHMTLHAKREKYCFGGNPCWDGESVPTRNRPGGNPAPLNPLFNAG